VTVQPDGRVRIVRWRRLLPSAIATGVGFAGLGVLSRFYFSSSIISDGKTGQVFMTGLIAIMVIMRRRGQRRA
jgi:uncharacterized BrkB/YihY/UPF0761 family membrane protein